MITAEQTKKLPKGDFRIETPNLRKPVEKVLRQVKEETKELPAIVGTLDEIIEEHLRVENKTSALNHARREQLSFKIQVLKKAALNKKYYFTHIFPQDPTGEYTRILRNGINGNGKATSTTN